ANIRTACYGKESNPPAPGMPAALTVELVVMQTPQSWLNDRDSMENMLRNQLQQGPRFVPEEKKQVSYTIRGQPVAVMLRRGKNPGTGERWREYIAIVSSEQRRLSVILITTETGGLSEEEVRQFFESFQ